MVRFSALKRAAVLGLPLLVGGLMAQPARAAEGPFGAISGNWSGTGTVSVSNGSSERIRCKATYSVSPSGEKLHQELRCASDSYKFEVSSNVIAGPEGSLSGTWTERTRQVTGAVSGQITGGTIDTAVNGPAFQATLQVSTKGNSQSVSIKPRNTDIQAIEIQMKRG